jgi:ubiquitin-protein ligase E3 A
VCQSKWNDDGYYLTGILVGLALYNGVLLDVHFPPAVYRKLLGLPLGLEDMVDEEVRKGLQQLLDYDGEDVEDIFCLNFDITWMDLGTKRKRELKSCGSRIAVTSDNKEEYVLAYVKWILVDSIAQQYDEFERGFMAVTGPDQNSQSKSGNRFCGTLDLLRPEAKYEGGFDNESRVVRNLWRYVKSADPAEQLRFLKFVTGSGKGTQKEKRPVFVFDFTVKKTYTFFLYLDVDS